MTSPLWDLTGLTGQVCSSLRNHCRLGNGSALNRAENPPYNSIVEKIATLPPSPRLRRAKEVAPTLCRSLPH